MFCLRLQYTENNEGETTAHQLNPRQVVTKINSGDVRKQCEWRNIAWDKILSPCLGKEIMQTSGKPGVIEDSRKVLIGVVHSKLLVIRKGDWWDPLHRNKGVFMVGWNNLLFGSFQFCVVSLHVCLVISVAYTFNR